MNWFKKNWMVLAWIFIVLVNFSICVYAAKKFSDEVAEKGLKGIVMELWEGKK